MKSAFTMFEVIFVMLILGILGAIAIPKLASVQDDAYVALEKSGISAVKSGALAIRSRALLRGTSEDFELDVNFEHAPNARVLISGNTTPTGLPGEIAANNKYPYALSVGSLPTNEGELLNSSFSGHSGTGLALALVMNPDGRLDWGTVKDGNVTHIAGPATLDVQSLSAEYNQNGSWKYDPTSGLINYQSDVAYLEN